MLTDISYRDYRKQNDIHGTVLYPATMIAPVQKDIIQDIMKQDKLQSIFDPFHGSGTALYEAAEIDQTIRLVGCDINPLANLITKAKLIGISKNIDSDIHSLKLLIEKNTADTYSFNNIDKWFREDIANDLRRIRQAIIEIENQQNRLYFWSLFSYIVRKYSNTRSSTYKLHSKNTEKIAQMKNNVIKDFINSIEENVEKYHNSTDNFELYKADTLVKIKDFPNKAFDMSITSPPYGDNQTTVPYGQFSSLALHWINDDDLNLEGWELDNYSIIDSKSMGGSKKKLSFDQFSLSLIYPYISRIIESKQEKVLNFFDDYFDFMQQLCRVTDKYIVMTLGNRTVDRVNIDLTNISKTYLEYLGFKNIQILSREIPSKRIPRKTSNVYNESVDSMNSEYVIIHQRIN